MKILDNNTQQHVSLLYAMLLINNKYSYIPELYDILGEKQTQQLLETFAGLDIKFPTVNEFRILGRDISIYFKLKNIQSNVRSRVVEDIAGEHLMSNDAVWKSYYRMRDQIKETGIEFIFNKMR